MNRFFPSLTALAILAHALLGCCAHEAHASDTCCELQVPTVHVACHCGAEHGDVEEDAPPKAPHVCHHGGCWWISCNAADSGVTLHHLWAGVGSTEAVDSSSLLAINLNDHLASLPNASPHQKFFGLPVRSHLAVGILLI